MSVVELIVEGFTVIKGIVEAIEDAKTGKITADDARAQIGKLMATLAANDAAADQALDDKFKGGS